MKDLAISDQKLSSDKFIVKAKPDEEEKKNGYKNQEEEKKEEPTRRSARNAGKEFNYDIDAILDEAEKINGSVGGSAISVMLA